jgi:hypothetical protein
MAGAAGKLAQAALAAPPREAWNEIVDVEDRTRVCRQASEAGVQTTDDLLKMGSK